jgi:hypothetical protein
VKTLGEIEAKARELAGEFYVDSWHAVVVYFAHREPIDYPKTFVSFLETGFHEMRVEFGVTREPAEFEAFTRFMAACQQLDAWIKEPTP